MKNSDLLRLKDADLEKILVARWLIRGTLVAAAAAAAILTTYIGTRGLHNWSDRLTVGALVALALAAGAGAFAMRRKDILIHRELKRRRPG